MRCSVVIRAYNEARHLGRLLEGISAQTCRDVETIVVDSGSTDATVEIAESHGARVVRISPQDFTFGRSLNIGVQAARAELVVIASAHVYPVYPDWIDCLLAPFKDADAAIVYGKQRGTSNSKYSEHRILAQWFPDGDIPAQSSPFCNNANAAIRRGLWQRRPYDETLTGLEDVEWAKWAQSQGGRIIYASHAEVVHIHNETPGAVFDRYRREGMAFKRIFPESHFSIYDCLRLVVANAWSDMLQARREHVLSRNLSSILWFRAAQFWGTYQGYRHSSVVTQQLRERFYYPRGQAIGTPSARGINPIEYRELAHPVNKKDQGMHS